MTRRARQQGGLLNIFFLLLVLLGHTSAQQQLSDIYYSNTHQLAFQKPFENESISILSQATGLTDNGTALCLTQPIPIKDDPTINHNASGRALVRSPVRIRDPVTNEVLSFSTMFNFWIQSSEPYDPGQGLAFVLSPDNSSTGSVGMYLGWLNSSTNGLSLGNFAVEFDIVKNSEFGDVDDNHVGVNVNNLTSVCSKGAGYWDSGKFHRLDLTTSSESNVYAWIDYNGTGKVVSVTVSNRMARPEKVLLTCPLDLGKFLSNHTMYVGFTASTGTDSLGPHLSQHSVFQWSFGIGNTTAVNLFGNETIPANAKSIPVPLAAGIGASALFLLVLLMCSVFLYLRKFRGERRNFPVNELRSLDSVRGPEKFSYRQLSIATKSFSKDTKIGQGGFGSVHRGALAKRSEVVAVKRISKSSNQGAQEFVAEVKVIGRVRHRNLVPLLGWCHDGTRGELLLVYEYMPNGSLEHLLFNKDVEVLSWEKRIRILCGVASALAFLHEEWEQRVVHRDVKASNVMLDADFNARLGDFGLARSYDHSQDPRSTLHVAGTVGYMAPELFNNGKPTEKTDVFSFGALALEIATGIQTSASPLGQSKTLADWVWSLYRNNQLLDGADTRLEGQFNHDEMLVVLHVGLLCSHPDGDSRPTMRQSLSMLKGEVPLRSLPLTRPLPPFAFSLGRSESMLFTGSTARDSNFDDISLYSPRGRSTTSSERSSQHPDSTSYAR